MNEEKNPCIYTIYVGKDNYESLIIIMKQDHESSR